MHVVCVHVRVKPGSLDAFRAATRENHENTIREPGNLRFDVLQSREDPARFLLYEVYRDEAGMRAHKETAHYARWRDTVEPMMAGPREGVKYAPLYPAEPTAWETR